MMLSYEPRRAVELVDFRDLLSDHEGRSHLRLKGYSGYEDRESIRRQHCQQLACHRRLAHLLPAFGRLLVSAQRLLGDTTSYLVSTRL